MTLAWMSGSRKTTIISTVSKGNNPWIQLRSRWDVIKTIQNLCVILVGHSHTSSVIATASYYSCIPVCSEYLFRVE